MGVHLSHNVPSPIRLRTRLRHPGQYGHAGYGYPGAYPYGPYGMTAEEIGKIREAEKKKYEDFVAAEKKKYEDYVAAQKKAVEDAIAKEKELSEKLGPYAYGPYGAAGPFGYGYGAGYGGGYGYGHPAMGYGYGRPF